MLMADHRILLGEGEMTWQKRDKKGKHSKPQQVYYFLFNDMILFAKPARAKLLRPFFSVDKNFKLVKHFLLTKCRMKAVPPTAKHANLVELTAGEEAYLIHMRSKEEVRKQVVIFNKTATEAALFHDVWPEESFDIFRKNEPSTRSSSSTNIATRRSGPSHKQLNLVKASDGTYSVSPVASRKSSLAEGLRSSSGSPHSSRSEHADDDDEYGSDDDDESEYTEFSETEVESEFSDSEDETEWESTEDEEEEAPRRSQSRARHSGDDANSSSSGSGGGESSSSSEEEPRSRKQQQQKQQQQKQQQQQQRGRSRSRGYQQDSDDSGQDSDDNGGRRHGSGAPTVRGAGGRRYRVDDEDSDEEGASLLGAGASAGCTCTLF
eukprot:TRINITY_DN5701_c0_g1_i1.p1 TRINITY_DN5701_c0_g1~~TRINITY_DN5701_c0_g1_i1.p1  ORF type:complete len:378 (-),score=100.21 TRINITY_DN5701_c0_g1_i1:11-1144(-)